MSCFHRTPWLLSAVFMLSLGGEAMAQGPRGGGASGDWRVTVDYDGRPMDSILALSRVQNDNRTGQWISFWGASDLSDIQFENGDLKFTWSVQRQGGEARTSRFSGRIEDGALTGTLSGERGEFAVKGQRVARLPRAVGNWALKFQVGEEEMTPTLKVTADADRNLAGEWVGERGEHKILAISADRNQLQFKRASKIDEFAFESTFSGTMDGDALTGKFTWEMGELDVVGTRVGTEAIGTWILDLESDRGPRKQRLRINQDLSALYGATEVAAVTLNGNQISFPMRTDFGDQPFEMTFNGTIDGATLTGELTTPRGTRKVAGAKVVRPPRNRPSQ